MRLRPHPPWNKPGHPRVSLREGHVDSGHWAALVPTEDGMKRFLLAALAAAMLAAGCATQTAWQDPYWQQQTGPQPRSDPLGR